ncbi:MAG TPA: type II toxin-antitoxin system VapC family toxin [Thermoanaerobaculia bacterium]|nr:type II toxin-antitoxin system VapC family toxin [Thermoanaerobaculia bacterium]
MTLVDSSGWIEFFTNGPLASRFQRYLADESEVVTPTIVLYEVYKLIRRERSEEEAVRAAAAMQRTRVVALTETIALTAADLALEHGLAMADAIVYATARMENAHVVTSDEDFEGLAGVTLFGKKRRR